MTDKVLLVTGSAPIVQKESKEIESVMLLMVYNVGNKWIISVNKWNILFKKMDDWSAAQKQ